jgi:hypothetical protein
MAMAMAAMRMMMMTKMCASFPNREKATQLQHRRPVRLQQPRIQLRPLHLHLPLPPLPPPSTSVRRPLPPPSTP